MTLVPQCVVFLPTTSSCKSFFPNIEDGNENVSESGFIGICWQKSALTKWIPIRCMAISPADNNASSGLASPKMSPPHILHFFFLLFYFLVFSSYWLHILGIFLDSPSDNLIKGIPLTQTIMHHVVWLPLQEVSPHPTFFLSLSTFPILASKMWIKSGISWTILEKEWRGCYNI